MISSSSDVTLPAGREEFRQQISDFQALELVRKLLEGLPAMAIAMNRDRKILYANRAAYEFLQMMDPDQVTGHRPGEAFGCIRALESAAGCGTTLYCRTCGTAQAIQECGVTGEATQECRMLRVMEGREEALDLKVHAAEISVGSLDFTLFTVIDISGQKRREVLERLFFHDLLNAVGGLKGLTWLLAEEELSERESRDLGKMALAATEQLIGIVEGQRALTMAERGDLRLDLVKCTTRGLLERTKEEFEYHPVREGLGLVIGPGTVDEPLVTDPTVLGRVIGNMVKNALEATQPGGQVIMGCRGGGDDLEYWVWNDGAMEEGVRLQIFHRSFSTKGPGRGLGTYSIKLLTEQFLGGQVSFESTPESGTVFRIRIPKKHEI